MDQRAEDIISKEVPPQPQLDSQNINHKKIQGTYSNRILKFHDLDRNLVYGKRGIKQSQISWVQSLNRLHEQKIKLKKEKKIHKIELKKLKCPEKEEYTQKTNINRDQLNQKQISKKNDQQEKNQQQNQFKLIPKFKKKLWRTKITKRGSKSKYKINWKEVISDDQSQQERRFPLLNHYVTDHADQYLATMEQIDQRRQKFINPDKGTYINCDVKYFNWNLFIEQAGKFDVLIIDPPWRIKGAQQNDSQFMFSNCKFSLDYNTMSNNQIDQLPLHLISDQGYIFLWILNTQLDSSLEIMQKWGYQLIDELVWVKLRDYKIYLTHGYYFMHSYQICLIGYKNNKNKSINSQEDQLKTNAARGKINANVIFGSVNLKSQKPEEVYSIIQMMFKGKRKVQIFARNHNRRFGIFSVGNQLGQSYEKWLQSTKCDKCDQTIVVGMKRYKSKKKADYDLCEECVPKQTISEFFQIYNEVNEDIRHHYISCNNCNSQPIWGNRFFCQTCHNFDLCQGCFDQHLAKQQKLHPLDHQFNVLQVPRFGNDFAIHQHKCYSCYQNPIVGICFSCTSCRNFKLCQKCYFDRPKGQAIYNSKNHRSEHQMEAIFEPQLRLDKKFQCFSCKKQIIENCWMCENCYNFFFCGECYENRNKFKSLYANTHKKYHVYIRLY